MPHQEPQLLFYRLVQPILRAESSSLAEHSRRSSDATLPLKERAMWKWHAEETADHIAFLQETLDSGPTDSAYSGLEDPLLEAAQAPWGAAASPLEMALHDLMRERLSFDTYVVLGIVVENARLPYGPSIDKICRNEVHMIDWLETRLASLM